MVFLGSCSYLLVRVTGRETELMCLLGEGVGRRRQSVCAIHTAAQSGHIGLPSNAILDESVE
jgi:hypothetical protein